jgi:hypothetical protein
MEMTTDTRQAGGVTIVDISGRIVLGEESAALRELVCDLISKGHRKILFNLGNVTYIDSSGLGQSGQCFHDRAEAGWRTEAAQPHEQGSQRGTIALWANPVVISLRLLW